MREFTENCLPVTRTIQETKNSHVYFSSLPDKADSEVVVKRAKISGKERLGRFWKEVALLEQAAGCPHVVDIIAVINCAPTYAIVLPRLSRGSLFDLLHHSTAAELSFSLKLSLALDFARGIEHLHTELQHVSKDIKPGNCLVDSEWTAVICDLENAEAIHTMGQEFKPSVATGPSGGYFKKFMVGTMVYMAPELLAKEPFSMGADVYSFGISLNEILTGTVPYSDVKRCDDDLQFHTVIEASYSQQALMQAVCTRQLRPHTMEPSTQISAASSEALVQLVQACWAPATVNRPTISAVCASLATQLAENPLQEFPSDELNQDPQNTTQNVPVVAECANECPNGSAADVPWDRVFSGLNANQAPPFTAAAGHEAMAGRRGSDKMEDRSFVFHEIAAPFVTGVHLFGVFDGHGGSAAAEFCYQNMLGAVLAALHQSPHDVQRALEDAFVAVDAAFVQCGKSSGATALVALVVGDVVLLSNCGDCRAVVARAGEALQLTTDHTASHDQERARVIADGGNITESRDGKLRVGGQIQVTRAIGDVAMKQHGLTACPQVSAMTIQPEDDFLLMATDGVWDTVSNEEAIRDVARTARHVDFGAKSLCMRAWTLGSDDNISSVCVYFNHDSVDYEERATTRHDQK